MLPVPFDVTIDHPQSYPSNAPPCVPRVPLLPEGEPLLVYAAAAIANEAGFKAVQTPARTFCYNMLADNFFNNAAFADVVKLVCDTCVLRHRMGQTDSPANVLVAVASEVLTMYASMLVISYPELSRILPGDHLDAAANNHRLYIELVHECTAMYQQPSYGQTAGYVAPAPGYAARGPAMRTPMRAGTQPIANPVAGNAYRGVNAPTSRPTSQAPQKAATQPTTASKPVESTLTGEIESMDRNQHSIVYYGKNYAMPTSPLRRKYEEAVETFEEIANSPSTAVSIYKKDVRSAEASLDELVAVTMSNWITDGKDELAIYQSTGLVVNPVLSMIDHKECFKALERATTFASVATILRQAIDDTKDTKSLRHTLFYVRQADRILTRILNDFLLHFAGLPKPTQVESFIEDAPTIVTFLNDKYKGAYNAAYIDYQKRILVSLFAFTKSSENAVSQVTDYSGDEYCDNITQAYILTYISATSAELGYKTDPKAAKKITRESTPLLRRLAEAVTKDASQRDLPPHHLVILADGTRYMLCRIAGKEDSFNLIEV